MGRLGLSVASDPLQSARDATRRVEQRYEAQLQVLENDKVSLLKRLNTLLVELDRLNQDKVTMQARLEALQTEQSTVQRRMDEEDAIKNATNKNLNEDLRYEREVNDKLRDEMKRLELERGHLLITLREQDVAVESYQKEQHDITRNLQKKADDISDLDQMRARTLDDLALLRQDLEQLKMREDVANSDTRVYKQEVTGLAKDRDDLIVRMNELTHKYEEFLKASDAESSEMRDHHRSLNKILTSKLIMGLLDRLASRARRAAFKSINGFTRSVHTQESVLRRCVAVCARARDHGAGLAFWKWYSSSMNFLAEQSRIDNVVDRRVQARTRASFFYHWREAFLKSVKRFDRKADGVKLWGKLFKRHSYLGLKTAFQRWAEKIDFHHEQRGELMRRLRQRMFGILEQAYLRWTKDTRQKRETEQIRTLEGQFSRIRYLQHLFGNFKTTCRDLRSQKLIIQFKTWKGWRDAYRRRIFLSNAEKAGNRMAVNYEEGLLRATFSALQLAVSMSKFDITRADLDRERRERQEAEVTLKLERHHMQERVRYKGARDVIRQLRSVLWSWFEHWKQNTFKHKEKVRGTFKLLILTWARRHTQAAMQRWKSACDMVAYETQLRYHQETMLENSELDLQIKLLQGEQKKRDEKVQLRKMTKLHTTLKRVIRRISKKYLQRWHEQASAKNDMFFASMKCSRKLYMRTMKERFAQWREGIKHAKVVAMLKGRFDDITASFDSRLVDRCYGAWCQYVDQNRIMTKALLRIGASIKNKGLNAAWLKWKDVNKAERMANLHDTSMHLLDQSNIMLGELDDMKKQEAMAQQQAEAMYRKMMKQAERVMSNFVVRCLNGTLGKGFYSWKDIVVGEKNKQALVRRAFLSLVFCGQRAAFSKWRDYVKWANRNAFKNYELGMKDEINDVNMTRLEANDLSATEISNMQIQQMQLQVNLDDFSARHGKQLEQMMKKKGKFLFCSRKRMIFESWRDAVHNERTAYSRLTKVMKMANRRIAFSQIRARAFQEGQTLNHQLRMNKIWMKFIKGQLASAFSKWRGQTLFIVRQEFSTVLDMTMDAKRMHDERVVGHNERVAVKAARHIMQRKSHNIFYSWFNIIKAWKALRVRGSSLQSQLLDWRAKLALHKWRARKEATKAMRRKQKKAEDFDKSFNMSRAFIGIKEIGGGEVNLAKVLRKIDRRVLHVEKSDAFFMLERNAKRKGVSKARQRKHGENLLALSMRKIFRRGSREAFHALRTLALEMGGNRLKVRKMMLQCRNRKMRHFFKKWMKQTDNYKMVDLVTFEGSTAMAEREHIVNEHILKKVANEQGYTMDQVARTVNTQHNQQQKVAHKYYSLIVDAPDKWRTVAFRAWQKFVSLRKRIRDKAKLCLQLLSQDKSFRAFRTWKLCVFGSKKRLMRLRKEHLISRIIDNSRDVSLGEDLISQRGHAIYHVTNEREILMQNYISSQKLGLGCMRMFMQRQVAHAFQLWKRHLKQGSEAELRVEAKKLALSIDTVKENLDLLRSENEKLVEENEELRQASLDGIEIAMAVQELTKEREQLSVDLADRATTIKKLLQENQILMETLQSVDSEMNRLQNSLQ